MEKCIKPKIFNIYKVIKLHGDDLYIHMPKILVNIAVSRHQIVSSFIIIIEQMTLIKIAFRNINYMRNTIMLRMEADYI